MLNFFGKFATFFQWILITKIIAKIPLGYTIEGGSNQIGDNSKQSWLTSKDGTGDWQEYIFKVECGLTGIINTTNYFSLGGFYFGDTTSSRKVFVTKIIAKIPTGYTLKWGSNGIGDGYSKWLSSQNGTGDWEEYIIKVNCGYSGDLSTTNFFYIDGASATSSNPVTWY